MSGFVGRSYLVAFVSIVLPLFMNSLLGRRLRFRLRSKKLRARRCCFLPALRGSFVGSPPNFVCLCVSRVVLFLLRGLVRADFFAARRLCFFRFIPSFAPMLRSAFLWISSPCCYGALLRGRFVCFIDAALRVFAAHLFLRRRLRFFSFDLV